MSAIFPSEKVVRGNTDKPRDAEFSGRFHGDQPIYREREPDIKQQPMKDALGKPVYKVFRNGNKRVEMEPYVAGYIEREFVIEDLGNGQTPKNYYFAPSEAEIHRTEAVDRTSPERVAAFMDRFERVTKKLGLSDEDVDKLAGDTPIEAGGK